MSSANKTLHYLKKEEIRDLLSNSDLRGFQAVFTSWGLITLAFASVAYFPSFWTVLFALILLGGRHLALGILMHDAAHYSLFKTRKLNDWIGKWVCAYPVAQDLIRYRKHHLKHHQLAGSARDPDLDLVEGFPVTRTSLARKFIRDLTGIAGLKRFYGVLLMGFGFIEFTVSSRVVSIDQKGRSFWNVVRTGISNLSGLVITNAVLFFLLWLWGKPELYGLWILSYLTTFSLFIRIRSIAEHACTGMGLDPIQCTRTTRAGIIARLTVAPHWVNYHLEHHLLMTVPGFKLAKMHRMLQERGAFKNAFVASSYIRVLITASAR